MTRRIFTRALVTGVGIVIYRGINLVRLITDKYHFGFRVREFHTRTTPTNLRTRTLYRYTLYIYMYVYTRYAYTTVCVGSVNTMYTYIQVREYGQRRRRWPRRWNIYNPRDSKIPNRIYIYIVCVFVCEFTGIYNATVPDLGLRVIYWRSYSNEWGPGRRRSSGRRKDDEGVVRRY